MGCEDEAPLGEFCVSEGAVQWVVAAAPSVTVLCGLAFWAHRTHALRRKQKEHAWRHDGEAQRDAAGVLDALSQAPAEERIKYARQVLQILRDFPDKAVIQHKGCVAIEAICRAKKGNSSSVQSAGAVPLLLAALESHLRVREVQRAGLGAVACLAKIAHNQLFSEGGIPIVLASMAKFKRDSAVQLSGAMAVGGLCHSSPKNRKSVAKYGGIAILLVALERHIERNDVLIAASEALVLITQDSPALREHLHPFAARVQGILAHVEGLRSRASQEATVMAGTDAAVAATKRGKEFEVVLKSLHKLQDQLRELAAKVAAEEPADASDGEEEDNSPGGEWKAALSQPAQQSAAPVAAEASDATGEAADLQDRLRKWNKKRKSTR